MKYKITIEKQEPYYPIPFREPNRVVRQYEEGFVDRSGNEAMITYVDYMDKRGKLKEGYVLRVKWDE